MIFSLAILGSFVLYLIVGAVVSRTVKSKADFFVSGRNAPTLLVGGTLVASFMSTVAFMGELGMAYDGYPVAMLMMVALNVCGYVIGVVLFGRYLRRSNALTVPEFFGKRFDSGLLQMITGLTVIIGIGFYLIAVTQGMMLVVQQLTGLSAGVSLLAVWLGYTVFTLLSGARGVLVNDTIMFFIFGIAAVGGISWVIFRAGGPTQAFEKMWVSTDRPDGLAWHGITSGDTYMGSPTDVLVWAVTLGIVWMLVVAVSPWQSSRYLMAKNEHVSIRSALMATASVLFLYVFLTFGGLAISLFNPDIDPSEVAFIWAAQNIMPTALGVISVTGIVAAGLSSAASFLSIIGFSVDNDVMPWFRHALGRKKKESDVRLTRWAMIAVALVALVFTYFSPPAVLTIGYFAATLFAASWGPLAFWCIRSEKLTTRGAIAGVITGFLSVGILEGIQAFSNGEITLPTWANPVLIGLVASIAATLIGNIGATPAPAGVEFLRTLRETPPEDRDSKQMRVTKAGAYVAGGVILLCGVMIIVFYALPTFAATS